MMHTSDRLVWASLVYRAYARRAWKRSRFLDTTIYRKAKAFHSKSTAGSTNSLNEGQLHGALQKMDS